MAEEEVEVQVKANLPEEARESDFVVHPESAVGDMNSNVVGLHVDLDQVEVVLHDEWKNGTIYSLVINCTGDNKSFFRKLNSALANQSCKILKDHTVNPENFELVKEKKYGCSVFAKIYCNKSGKTKCRIPKRSYKNLIEIDELQRKLYTQSLSGLHWFKQIHKSISTRDISKRG